MVGPLNAYYYYLFFVKKNVFHLFYSLILFFIIISDVTIVANFGSRSLRPV